jgi:peroxiredoxin Q/BCP
MTSPAVGSAAPDFTLEGVAAGKRQSFSLSGARGSAVVLAFYPGDDTMTCTKQLCSYQDSLDVLGGLGATLWGISPQDVDSHERFAAKRGLAFPLLADPSRTAIKAYGANGPMGHTKRSVFVIDPSGIVRWSHVSLLGVTYQDSEKIASVLSGLQVA